MASQDEIFSANRIRYESGQVEFLVCPHGCGEQVSVYFDGPREVESEIFTRVYFFCEACRKWDRIAYPGVAPHFDERRVIEELRRE